MDNKHLRYGLDITVQNFQKGVEALGFEMKGFGYDSSGTVVVYTRDGVTFKLELVIPKEKQ